MKNNFIITEEDKKKILNQHITATKNQYLMVEALGGTAMSVEEKMKAKYPNGIGVPYTVKASGGKAFSNGIDKINDKDPEINEIIKTIEYLLTKAKGKVNVNVVGGASAVGTSQGYDNTALAERRRDNLINYLKQTFNDRLSRLNITKGKPVLGKSTVKDSPSAQKEQFVSAKISGERNEPLPYIDKGDNTNASGSSQGMPKVDMDFTPKKGKTKRVCVQIPEQYVELFKMSLREFKKENSLSTMPFSVSDLK